MQWHVHVVHVQTRDSHGKAWSPPSTGPLFSRAQGFGRGLGVANQTPHLNPWHTQIHTGFQLMAAQLTGFSKTNFKRPKDQHSIDQCLTDKKCAQVFPWGSESSMASTVKLFNAHRSMGYTATVSMCLAVMAPIPILQ
jgi:hypothetical protein